jgi:hypothetical protein
MLLFTILLASALLFVGGLADGLNQTILHHYGAFKRRFPRANDAWADPKISWMNKYAAKRPFFLVWTTDLYHLTRTVDRWCWLLKDAARRAGARLSDPPGGISPRLQHIF